MAGHSRQSLCLVMACVQNSPLRIQTLLQRNSLDVRPRRIAVPVPARERLLAEIEEEEHVEPKADRQVPPLDTTTTIPAEITPDSHRETRQPKMTQDARSLESVSAPEVCRSFEAMSGLVRAAAHFALATTVETRGDTATITGSTTGSTIRRNGIRIVDGGSRSAHSPRLSCRRVP